VTSARRPSSGSRSTLRSATLFATCTTGAYSGLAWRIAALDSALVATAVRQSRVLPRELAHLILFYTAGEAVRTLVPDHVPYAESFGVWTQNESARRYRALIEREWQPHLEGCRSFAEAVARIVDRLPRQAM
jgi:hypothetical protein